MLPAALALALLPVQQPALDRIIPLQGETHHVQGIDLDGQRLWVTSVDTKTRQGYLHEFRLPSGHAVRTVPSGAGARSHPGGIATDKLSIWIPAAEYRRDSTTTIERRDKRTLRLISSFEVQDHIGCIAATNNRLYGANWDARQIYEWDLQGNLLSRRDNPTGNRFQDLKFIGGELVGAGLFGETGGIDWLDPVTLTTRRRITLGKTDRGVKFTNEGMALRRGRLYLLPEDGPSRLFVFRLPERSK